MKKTEAQKSLLRKYKMIPFFWKVLSETFNVTHSHHRMMVVNIITGEVIALEE